MQRIGKNVTMRGLTPETFLFGKAFGPKIIGRPDGLPSIPAGWKVTSARGEGGVLYYNPPNANQTVRVMPGKPSSPYPNSRGPYVRQTNAAGTHYRADGSLSPLPRGGKYDGDAHIPLKDFIFSN
jgi:hypothetical protein